MRYNIIIIVMTLALLLTGMGYARNPFMRSVGKDSLLLKIEIVDKDNIVKTADFNHNKIYLGKYKRSKKPPKKDSEMKEYMDYNLLTISYYPKDSIAYVILEEYTEVIIYAFSKKGILIQHSILDQLSFRDIEISNDRIYILAKPLSFYSNKNMINAYTPELQLLKSTLISNSTEDDSYKNMMVDGKKLILIDDIKNTNVIKVLDIDNIGDSNSRELYGSDIEIYKKYNINILNRLNLIIKYSSDHNEEKKAIYYYDSENNKKIKNRNRCNATEFSLHVGGRSIEMNYDERNEFLKNKHNLYVAKDGSYRYYFAKRNGEVLEIWERKVLLKSEGLK